jgi:ABC-type branched-subunit amino acid transport system ATPase component
VSEPLLVVERMSVAYGKVEAVRGVSLNVPAGSVVTVIGANGAGKTTLLNALMGLLDQTGSISFENRDLRNVRVEDRVAAGLVIAATTRSTKNSPRSMRAFRACVNASVNSPARSRAASDRCWRSGAR